MSAVFKELVMFPAAYDIYIEDKPTTTTIADGESIRPPLPYAQLIKNAIQSSDSNKMTLSSIYAYVIEQYPYFKNAAPGWKNSIRHNLSLNKNFVRVPRPTNEKGKGAYWAINETPIDKKNPHRKSNPYTKKNPKAASGSCENRGAYEAQYKKYQYGLINHHSYTTPTTIDEFHMFVDWENSQETSSSTLTTFKYQETFDYLNFPRQLETGDVRYQNPKSIKSRSISLTESEMTEAIDEIFLSEASSPLLKYTPLESIYYENSW